MHTSVSSLNPAAAQPLPRSPVLLGGVLGLRPLDRVQIAPKDVRIECRRDGSQWPWRFFQRPLPDGRIEVASDAGAIDWVDPGEVVDLQRCEPVAVRAWSPERYRGFFAVRGNAAIESYRVQSEFHEANVMRFEKDRWGRIDRVWVWFAQDSLNEATSDPFPARVRDEDRQALASLTRRVCPIARPTGRGAWSSDAGLQAQADRVARRSRAWLCESLGRAPAHVPRVREALLAMDALAPASQQAIDRQIRARIA